MKEVLLVIAKALVDKPQEVCVTEVTKDGQTTLELKVAKDDMGKIIGKQGKIAKSIRSVIKSVAIHRNIRVNVEILSDEEANAAE